MRNLDSAIISWDCADNGILMVRAGCTSSFDGNTRNTDSTLAEKAWGGVNYNEFECQIARTGCERHWFRIMSSCGSCQP